MNTFSTPQPPLPEPLSGSAIGSFAHSTITKRFPKIANETIQDNDFPPQIISRFQQLIDEIPHTPLRLLQDPGAPDILAWDKGLQPYMGKDWLEAPWFVAEMYFYRRILEATGFHQPGPYQGFDPFQEQKRRVLETADSSTENLASLLEKSIYEKQVGKINWSPFLQQLLVLNVWGNQADLSMWSADERRPDHRSQDDQHTHLLVNDAQQVVQLLSERKELERVDFILDNYGPELIHDIGLADLLLTFNLSRVVRLHAKPTPHYVSDAMIQDVYSTVNYLGNHDSPATKNLANRIQKHIRDQRLEIVDDYFWTSPTYFWEMPGYIRDELRTSDLVISKGDANYRRLAGDLSWPLTTPFEDVVRYFPTSLLALRVLKAELALGISPSQVDQLDEQDPGWQVNGQWAVIQFFQQ